MYDSPKASRRPLWPWGSPGGKSARLPTTSSPREGSPASVFGFYPRAFLTLGSLLVILLLVGVVHNQAEIRDMIERRFGGLAVQADASAVQARSNFSADMAENKPVVSVTPPVQCAETAASGVSKAVEEEKGKVMEAEKKVEGEERKVQEQRQQLEAQQKQLEERQKVLEQQQKELEDKRKQVEEAQRAHEEQEQERQWPKQAFRLRLQVLVSSSSTPSSLSRLLHSLVNADYGGDSVKLQLHVDHFEEASVEKRRLEEGKFEEEAGEPTDEGYEGGAEPGTMTWQGKGAAADVEQQLAGAKELLQFLDDLDWPHGIKDVQYRSSHVGSSGQWVDSWWPSSDSEFALVLEDDSEVSPLFYSFLKATVTSLFNNASAAPSDIYGLSLDQSGLIARHPSPSASYRLSSSSLLLYPMTSSSSQLLFPRPWREFRLWLDSKLARRVSPTVGGLVSANAASASAGDTWQRSERGDLLWSSWFLKFVHVHGYFNLYAHFKGGHVLAVSHKRDGDAQEVSPDSDSSPAAPVESLLGLETQPAAQKELQRVVNALPPSPDQLPRYDFCYKRVTYDRVAEDQQQLKPLIASVQLRNIVILVDTLLPSTTTSSSPNSPTDSQQQQQPLSSPSLLALLSNWMCRARLLDYPNVIALTDDPVISSAVQRKGNAVIRSDLVFGEKSDEASNSTSEAATGEAVRHKKEQLWLRSVGAVLAQGYDVIATGADTAWVRDDVMAIVYELGTEAEVVGLLGAQEVEQEAVSQEKKGVEEESETESPEDYVEKKVRKVLLPMGLPLYLRNTKEVKHMWEAVTVAHMQKGPQQSVAGGGLSLERLLLKGAKKAQLAIHPLAQSLFTGLGSYSAQVVNSKDSAAAVISLADAPGMEKGDVERVGKALGEAELWSVDEDLACSQLSCQ